LAIELLAQEPVEFIGPYLYDQVEYSAGILSWGKKNIPLHHEADNSLPAETK
jgi:hypothetical protein